MIDGELVHVVKPEDCTSDRRAGASRNELRSHPNCHGACGALLLVAGCTVGPNYKRPSATAPPAFKESGVPPPGIPNGTWKQAQPSDQALRGKWWEIYRIRN